MSNSKVISCSLCRGLGSVDGPPKPSGRENTYNAAPTKVICPSCKGKGSLIAVDADNLISCPFCGGIGRDGGHICPVCKGRGKVIPNTM